ncbi:protein TPX2-like isoform X1 [Primulina huaijiensis]|uniref:protein TPX2-like isoform X1 n=1 Tax=Primulina huaijiensis TaxID=1492673 RepID=UPI003CC76027
MAVLEESLSMNPFAIDNVYEFSAPRFYDFLREETNEDIRKAELWFENARSYAPSPFNPRIKAIRSVQTQILCKFDEDEQLNEVTETSESASNSELQADLGSTEAKEEVAPAEIKMQNSEIEKISDNKGTCSQENESQVAGNEASSAVPADVQGTQITPAPSKKIENKSSHSARKIASLLKNPSAMKSKYQLQNSQVKSIKRANVKRENSAKNNVGTPNLAHDYPAIKKQKLEGGQSRQIQTINKPANLPHKTRLGTVSNSSNLRLSNAAKTCKEERRMYVREPAVPFVSMAEMMNKFQSSTREMTLPRSSSVSQSNATGTVQQRKLKLTLTRPKTPEFETSQRVRSTKIKSSAELEEEMMAKIPKFKALPLNKKILEAPTRTAIQKSAPQPPQFKEFHLETMSRANQKAETSTVASIEPTQEQNNEWKPQLTAPKSPLLQTYLRARPPRVKTSIELEEEELKKVPQFKARPLNRKILESKGEIGLLSNTKKPVTIPQEFHFAIDKRIPPPTAVLDLFDKLSLVSEPPPHQEKLPRNTTLDPFHLHTEERGAEKEKKRIEELMQKQLEEERARIPKAIPYPYTTDYPEIPPKPEPKPCTKPEPFRLESLLKHEEEMQREMEERRRIEMDEAQMRIFKAQPILKEDPIPVPEIQRKPLTEVQVFNLQINHRAAERAEFDKKIKEKEATYKRYREEAESERMMEEEKALKQLRRTLVPHARPVPNFDNPFLPQKSSKVVTKAKSPRMHIARTNEKRRVVFPAPATATSAAASHMR